MKQWVNKDEKIVKINDRTSIVVKKGIPARKAKADYLKKMKELNEKPKEGKHVLQQHNSELAALLKTK